MKTQIYITDKTGRKFFSQLVTKNALPYHKKAYDRNVEQTKKYPKLHLYLDTETARVETKPV